MTDRLREAARRRAGFKKAIADEAKELAKERAAEAAAASVLPVGTPPPGGSTTS